MLVYGLLATLFVIWFGAFASLAVVEPEKVVLFGRVFVATCLGLAHMIGL